MWGKRHFPRGEFTTGREISEEELLKGNCKLWNLPEFLYKILII